MAFAWVALVAGCSSAVDGGVRDTTVGGLDSGGDTGVGFGDTASNGGGDTDTTDGVGGPGFQVGQSPPDFTLVDQTGATVSLAASRGHVVLLEFSGFT
jgi:hypothetical protein